MNKAETLALQRELYQLGFYVGPLDGIYGPRTERAYSAYLATRPPEPVPVVTPEPAKPWWTSRAMLGAIATIGAGLAGIAGYTVDAGQTTDVMLSIATTIAGALAWYGTIKRKSTIDPTLVARLGTRAVRLPGLRPLPTDPAGVAAGAAQQRTGPLDHGH